MSFASKVATKVLQASMIGMAGYEIGEKNSNSRALEHQNQIEQHMRTIEILKNKQNVGSDSDQQIILCYVSIALMVILILVVCSKSLISVMCNFYQNNAGSRNDANQNANNNNNNGLRV